MHERRTALRLALYFGQLSPLILAAPSGRDLIRDLVSLDVQQSSTSILADVDNVLGLPSAWEGRIWIVALHWLLHEPQEKLQMRLWLELLRTYAPVKPGYLTGVNWEWFDDYVQARRIKAFRGDYHACYALLLRQIEERTNDSWLRIAIEPLAKDRDLDHFVSDLLDQYEEASLAFIRYFLLPETILLLRLAPNYTAALAGRLGALRNCVRRFGYTDYFSEKQYEDESRALTAAVYSKSISGSRFEIAWEIFRRDVAEEERYFLETIHALVSTHNELALLGSAKVQAPHQFPNGYNSEYTFENRYWPFAQAVLVIIDSFIQHPSVGIEVILSTRFRHDTIRREFEKSFTKLREVYIPGVFEKHKSALIEHFEPKVLGNISQWLDKHMQTLRPSQQEALFNFGPSQQEMDEMVRQLIDSTQPQQIIDVVCNWLAERVRTSAAMAMMAFDQEMRSSVTDVIAKATADLVKNGNYRSEDVVKVSEAISARVTQQVDALLSWFGTEAPDQRPAMTYYDVKIAADGLYETYMEAGSLSTQSTKSPYMDKTLVAEQSRLLFDLIDEVYANAIKHGRARVRVRLNVRKTQIGYAIIASSNANFGEEWQKSIVGSLYRSTSDVIFGEDNSGLRKIASLTSTIRGVPTEIIAIRREQYFHLILPLLDVPE